MRNKLQYAFRVQSEETRTKVVILLNRINDYFDYKKRIEDIITSALEMYLKNLKIGKK